MNVILPELMTRRLKDYEQNNNTVDIVCVCGKAEVMMTWMRASLDIAKLSGITLSVLDFSSTGNLVLSHM